MTYITIYSPSCFSHAHDFEVSKDDVNDLSKIKYDGESGAAMLRHEVSFAGFFHKNEVPLDEISYEMFAYTLHGHAHQWCHTLPMTSIHSYDPMIKELIHDFYHYDCKALNKKIQKLQKTLDESLM